MEKSEYENLSGQDAARMGSIQGEGDYRAAREYREQVETFLEHADVAKAAREAAPRNPEEARELEQAEEAGRSHAKGRSLPPDMRTSKAALASVPSATWQRPLVGIVLAGVLGYFIGRMGQRG